MKGSQALIEYCSVSTLLTPIALLLSLALQALMVLLPGFGDLYMKAFHPVPQSLHTVLDRMRFEKQVVSQESKRVENNSLMQFE